MLDVNFQRIPPNSWKPIGYSALVIRSFSKSVANVKVISLGIACVRALVVVLQGKRFLSTWPWCCKSSTLRRLTRPIL